jgi:hypothetical protein
MTELDFGVTLPVGSCRYHGRCIGIAAVERLCGAA